MPVYVPTESEPLWTGRRPAPCLPPPAASAHPFPPLLSSKESCHDFPRNLPQPQVLHHNDSPDRGRGRTSRRHPVHNGHGCRSSPDHTPAAGHARHRARLDVDRRLRHRQRRVRRSAPWNTRAGKGRSQPPPLRASQRHPRREASSALRPPELRAGQGAHAAITGAPPGVSRRDGPCAGPRPSTRATSCS